MNTFAVSLSSFFVLSTLTLCVKGSRRFNLFDHWLHHKLVRNRDGLGWQIITFLMDPKLMVVWAILLASTFINNENYSIAIWVLGTLGLTDLAGIFLKKAIKRRRPIMASDHEDGYSFPSGHVLGTTTMVLILIQLFGSQMGIAFNCLLIVIWLMVVISRLSLKAHYPSDVIGATSLAVCCFGIAQQILFLL